MKKFAVWILIVCAVLAGCSEASPKEESVPAVEESGLEETDGSSGESAEPAQEEIFPCKATADVPAAYEMEAEGTAVLGTEAEAARLREFLSNLNGDKVRVMSCTSGPWDFAENHREISPADSVRLLTYLKSLTDFEVYDQMENPWTGGFWSVYLETADGAYDIGSPGGWLMATLPGPEGNKTYIFDAAGAMDACNDIDGVIGHYLDAPLELSDGELSRFAEAVSEIFAEYRAGAVEPTVSEGASVSEGPSVPEGSFEPLPKRCRLPEYVTVGVLNILFNEVLGCYDAQLYASNGMYRINLRVNAVPNPDTGETGFEVSAAGFQSIEEEFVWRYLRTSDCIGMWVESCEEDEAETLRVAERYKGSALAKSRGWSDEMLENRFVALYAIYHITYDHAKTSLTDGRKEIYLYFADPENTGDYTLVESTTPSPLPEPE